jgi:hypothetical protein
MFRAEYRTISLILLFNTVASRASTTSTAARASGALVKLDLASVDMESFEMVERMRGENG